MEKILYKLKNEPQKISDEELKSLSDEQKIIFQKELTKLMDINLNFEKTKKRQIVSLYGALANKYFPLYDIKLANSITSFGRTYIKTIGDKIISFLNSDKALIYTHTDSLFFSLESFKIKSRAELKDMGFKFAKIANLQFKYLDNVFNSKNKGSMNMDFEIMADKALFTNSGRYIISDTKFKEKMVGIEVLKSGTPFITKKYFMNNINEMFDSNEIIFILKKIYKEFKNETLEYISFNATIKNIDKYIIKDINKKNIYNNLFELKKIIIKENNPNKKESLLNHLNDIENEIDNDIINYDNVYKLINKLDINSTSIKSSIDKFKNKSKISSVFDIDGYLIKPGCPIHIVSAINHNMIFDCEKIHNGNQVQYLYLKNNNPYGIKTIAFKKEIDIENIKMYIDYDLQFEKGVLNPFNELLQAHKIKVSINDLKEKEVSKVRRFFED